MYIPIYKRDWTRASRIFIILLMLWYKFLSIFVKLLHVLSCFILQSKDGSSWSKTGDKTYNNGPKRKPIIISTGLSLGFEKKNFVTGLAHSNWWVIQERTDEARKGVHHVYVEWIWLWFNPLPFAGNGNYREQWDWEENMIFFKKNKIMMKTRTGRKLGA